MAKIRELKVSAILLNGRIEDISKIIDNEKNRLLHKEGITICRVGLQMSYTSNLSFYKEMTSIEIKEEEDKKIAIKLANEKRKLELQKQAEDLSRKMSDAAKKGWIKRKENLKIEKEVKLAKELIIKQAREKEESTRAFLAELLKKD